MGEFLLPILINTDVLNGIYKEPDRGTHIQVSRRQYVLGIKQDFEKPARVDFENKSIFLKGTTYVKND